MKKIDYLCDGFCKIPLSKHVFNMIDLFDPNINFADFHHVKADEKQPKERYFVPFCRVLPEYKHMFKNQEHKWGELPDEIYASLQETV